MVITFTVDSAAVRKKLAGASALLRRKVYNKLNIKTKRDLFNTFDRRAPQKSHALKASKRAQVFEDEMTLKFFAGEGLSGTTGFEYADWVAGIIPTITIVSPNKYFMVGQTIAYGDPGAVTPSGDKVNWSANWAPESDWWRVGIVQYANRKVPQDVNQAVKEFVKEMNN